MIVKRLLKTWRVLAATSLAELFGGLVLNGPSGSPITTVTYSTTPTINASLGNMFVMTITDAVAFVFAAPTNTLPVTIGQEITIICRNTSGGAHGAGTFNAVFKTVAAPFPAIATGQNRTIGFRWNGTNWVETFRSAADVAN